VEADPVQSCFYSELAGGLWLTPLPGVSWTLGCALLHQTGSQVRFRPLLSSGVSATPERTRNPGCPLDSLRVSLSRRAILGQALTTQRG